MGDLEVSRRAVVAGVVVGTGALALGATACSTYGTPTVPPTAAAQSAAPASGAGGAVAPLARKADIPVGAGTIFASQQVVITQPADGTFKAFSAVCTHQGCIVATVTGGTINCDCHGSKFKITDGSVVAGPATRPLAAKAVVAQGDSLVVA
jgi:Rieske Fe-S protein